MIKNPMRYLRNRFPWPGRMPDVPPTDSGWFRRPKQILLNEVVPTDCGLIVELGSWVGQSTRWFLRHCPRTTVIAVDTWLGSCEHLHRRRRELETLHETFLVNCWEFRDRLIPFRNTSLAAMHFVAGLGLRPDAIYFDSDHSFWGLLAELETAHELFPDALMIGDDSTAATVSEALNIFTEGFDRWEERDWSWRELNNSWVIEKRKK